MTNRLIDTNILVYAYDISEGEKHEISKNLLKQIWEKGGGVVCLQNLMEFFVVVTKKVENPIDITMAKKIINDFLQSDKWIVIDRDEETFLSAVNLVNKYGVHLWDSLIAACMKESGITEIVTENKKDFDKISDIKVILPF